MSEMQRWFPLSVFRSTRGFFDRDDFDDFSSLDRQMRTMQQDMDRMSSNFQRLARQPSGIGASPLDFRQAEDALALNPIIGDKDGQKKMQMNFDVRAFKPEEINVKTKDGKYMEVQAKHEESTDNGKVLRHYHRMFTIPPGVQTEDMSSMLSPDGVLTITAPIRDHQPAVEAAPKKERPIAIKHE